jgi:alpha-1,3-rhamnosyl/mannosyltransferase
VLATGHVDSADLVELYRGARCFLFPSRYEGFGLPVLEAMACGTPVVCSDGSSLPEVAGGAALLVPPDDTAAIAEAVQVASTSGSERERLVAAGLERAGAATWQLCAELTVQAYRRALGSRASTSRQ